MLKRASPLAAALIRGGSAGADGQRRIKLVEVRGWTLLQVAAFPGVSGQLERAIWDSLDTDLPKRVGCAHQVRGCIIFRVGPEQLWVLSRTGMDSESIVRAAVPAQVGAVTSLTHSRTCLSIEGPDARDVLSKGIPIDLHPKVFSENAFVLTGLRHTPVLLHRSADSRFDLYVLRTFALCLWDWLTDAARAHGVETFLEDYSGGFFRR